VTFYDELKDSIESLRRNAHFMEQRAKAAASLGLSSISLDFETTAVRLENIAENLETSYRRDLQETFDESMRQTGKTLQALTESK
jgi:hypothetical protein